MTLTDGRTVLKCSYKDIERITTFNDSGSTHWHSFLQFNKPIIADHYRININEYFFVIQSKEEIEKMIEIEKFNESFEDKLK